MGEKKKKSHKIQKREGYETVCLCLHTPVQSEVRKELGHNLAIHNKSKRITGQKIITTNETARVNVLKHLH